jgi:hypothetical protein
MADLVPVTSSVVASQTGNVATAGVAITAGQVLCDDPANTSQVILANATDPDRAKIRGIALDNAAAGQPVVYTGGVAGAINLGTTLAQGETYVLSANDGNIAPVADLVAGNYVTYIGIGASASSMTLMVRATGITIA